MKKWKPIKISGICDFMKFIMKNDDYSTNEITVFINRSEDLKSLKLYAINMKNGHPKKGEMLEKL